MISRVRGIILEKIPPLVLLEVEGVGYEIHMPMNCFSELPNIGKEVIIFTHFIVREDTHLLFGFNSKQERTLFRDLIKINYVGPKLALTILSGMSTKQFAHAVERKDYTSLVSLLITLPGVGKKTAERLILEMKDRFKKIHNNFFVSSENCSHTHSKKNTTLVDEAEKEAITALVTLGYTPHEASHMIRRIRKLEYKYNSETLISEALRAAL